MAKRNAKALKKVAPKKRTMPKLAQGAAAPTRTPKSDTLDYPTKRERNQWPY